MTVPRRLGIDWVSVITGTFLPAFAVALLVVVTDNPAHVPIVCLAPAAVLVLMLSGAAAVLYSARLTADHPARPFILGVLYAAGAAAFAAGLMLLTTLDFTPHFLIVISFLMLVPVGLVLLYASGFIYRARQVRGLGGGAAKADSAWVTAGFACTVLLAAAPEVGHRLWLDNQLSRLQAGGDPKVWVQSLTTIKASPLCSSNCSFRYGDLSFHVSCPDRVCRRLATTFALNSPTPFTVNPWITIPALYQDVLWTYFGTSVVQRCGATSSSGVLGGTSASLVNSRRRSGEVRIERQPAGLGEALASVRNWRLGRFLAECGPP